eukprot:g1470.t1
MALPAHLIWERTRALACASYPQLSAPDGFEFAGVRRPNDPSLPHVRYELPDDEDVTNLAAADGVDIIAAKIRFYLNSGRLRASMVTDEGQRSGVEAALKCIDELLVGPLDGAAGRHAHAAIHIVQQPNALTNDHFVVTMAAIQRAEREATRCGDTAAAYQGQWPATLFITRAPTAAELSAAAAANKKASGSGPAAPAERLASAFPDASPPGVWGFDANSTLSRPDEKLQLAASERARRPATVADYLDEHLAAARPEEARGRDNRFGGRRWLLERYLADLLPAAPGDSKSASGVSVPIPLDLSEKDGRLCLYTLTRMLPTLVMAVDGKEHEAWEKTEDLDQWLAAISESASAASFKGYSARVSTEMVLAHLLQNMSTWLCDIVLKALREGDLVYAKPGGGATEEDALAWQQKHADLQAAIAAVIASHRLHTQRLRARLSSKAGNLVRAAPSVAGETAHSVSDSSERKITKEHGVVTKVKSTFTAVSQAFLSARGWNYAVSPDIADVDTAIAHKIQSLTPGGTDAVDADAGVGDVPDLLRYFRHEAGRGPHDSMQEQGITERCIRLLMPDSLGRQQHLRGLQRLDGPDCYFVDRHGRRKHPVRNRAAITGMRCRVKKPKAKGAKKMWSPWLTTWMTRSDRTSLSANENRAVQTVSAFLRLYDVSELSRHDGPEPTYKPKPGKNQRPAEVLHYGLSPFFYEGKTQGQHFAMDSNRIGLVIKQGLLESGTIPDRAGVRSHIMRHLSTSAAHQSACFPARALADKALHSVKEFETVYAEHPCTRRQDRLRALKRAGKTQDISIEEVLRC